MDTNCHVCLIFCVFFFFHSISCAWYFSTCENESLLFKPCHKKRNTDEINWQITSFWQCHRWWKNDHVFFEFVFLKTSWFLLVFNFFKNSFQSLISSPFEFSILFFNFTSDFRGNWEILGVIYFVFPNQPNFHQLLQLFTLQFTSNLDKYEMKLRRIS